MDTAACDDAVEYCKQSHLRKWQGSQDLCAYKYLRPDTAIYWDARRAVRPARYGPVLHLPVPDLSTTKNQKSMGQSRTNEKKAKKEEHDKLPEPPQIEEKGPEPEENPAGEQKKKEEEKDSTTAAIAAIEAATTAQ